MKLAKSVVDYLNSSPWKEELEELRSILLETELKEELKWGTPHYTLGGKIVVGMAGFKSYYGLWFHQGVFLKDQSKVLVNAQEGTTKGLRQWRFQSGDRVDTDQVKEYVLEAIVNQRAGKEIKVEPKKVSIPDELKEALACNAKLSEAYDSLTPGRRKEYAEYIGSAKQEKTRLSRLEKSVPMILQGVGLNDKYKGS